MVQQQAWLMSFMDVFYLLTVLFATLAVFAMLMRKPARAGRRRWRRTLRPDVGSGFGKLLQSTPEKL